jgi:hypothetical protein
MQRVFFEISLALQQVMNAHGGIDIKLHSIFKLRIRWVLVVSAAMWLLSTRISDRLRIIPE